METTAFSFVLDSNGAEVVQYSYDAWGNHTVSGSNTALGNRNPFRYRGYFYDTDTGFYYLKTRYYDPEVGRFISADDVSYLDPESIFGLNLYAYCGNNPVKYTDPTGTIGVLATLIIATLVGAALNAAFEVGKQIYNDGDWNWDLKSWNWAQIGAQALIGAVEGFACGLGGVAGGIAKGTIKTLKIAGKVLSASQSVAVLFGTALMANFLGGVGSYAIQSIGSDDDFNLLYGITKGLAQLGKGAISFYIGGMYASFGVWNIGGKNSYAITNMIGRGIIKFCSTFLLYNIFDSF